jgi:hypothetical protein
VRRQDRRVGFVTSKRVGIDRFLPVQAWFNRGLARPAVRRGQEVASGQAREERRRIFMNEGDYL